MKMAFHSVIKMLSHRMVVFITLKSYVTLSNKCYSIFLLYLMSLEEKQRQNNTVVMTAGGSDSLNRDSL